MDPIQNADLITRYKLNDLFTGIPTRNAIYVSAPGGYGKTLAVSQWINKDRRTSAVISLDIYDNDPVHFCKRFCAMLHVCQPDNSALENIVSDPAFAGSPDKFSLRAVASLTKRKRIILAIDDLHVIHNKEIIRLLLFFLKRLPENIQIVLIGRNDLPSVFSELWLKGQLTYITSKDLIFDIDEIIRLYKKKGITQTIVQAEEIFRFTGGWAIGITALLLSGVAPTEGNLDYLEDFISSNVWEKWDENTRGFMLDTAAANVLYPSLCDKLTNNSNSEAVLKELLHKSFFIYRTEDGVYHYHHLFKDFLLGKLLEKGDIYVSGLLCIEGDWYFSKNELYIAADCYIHAKNHAGIANCFRQPGFIDRKNLMMSALASIVNNPETITAAEGDYPFLYYAMSWLALIEGRSDDAFFYMDRFYARCSEIIDTDPSYIYNLYFLYLLDKRISFDELAKKISDLPQKPDITNIEIKNPVITDIFLMHRTTIDFSELATDDTPASVSLFLKEQVGCLFGSQAGLISDCITALLLYEQGHLEKAYTYALAAYSGTDDINTPEFKLATMSVLVFIMDATGQKQEAENILDHMKKIIEKSKLYHLENDIYAIMTQRQLANGSTGAANRWLAKHRNISSENVGLNDTYMTFTTCRAYIVSGEYSSAIKQLTQILNSTKVYGKPLDKIEAYILLAIANWKIKRTFQKDAMIFLEDAVSLAYKYGYTQMFINDGAELLNMLQRLKKRTEQIGDSAGKPPASFVKMLHLRALEHRGSGLTSSHSEPDMKYTDKQRVVMSLLCEGNSYNEIAEKVGIKRTTLRSHIALIYKKLGVTNGIDAVKKINSLNLL